MNFKIADGEPDIRGWEVRTLAGVELGEVDDLLIDPHRNEVVMLSVDLKDSDEHVNIPIRGVQLDRDRKRVVVDSGDISSARESYMGDSVDEGRLREDARIADSRRVDERGDRVVTEGDRTEEVVVERRPVIEEVVVRRRVVDSDQVDDV